MSVDLAELRVLLETALARLDTLEAQGLQTARERRDAALRAAADALDPAASCTVWRRACLLEAELRTFDRRGDLVAGRRTPSTDVERHLVAAHRAGLTIPSGARQLYRVLTSATGDDA